MSGPYTLHTASRKDRPIVIVDSEYFEVFSFTADDADYANEMLSRLNNPEWEWPEAEAA